MVTDAPFTLWMGADVGKEDVVCAKATFGLRGAASKAPESASNGPASRREERVDIRWKLWGIAPLSIWARFKVGRQFGKSPRIGQNNPSHSE